MHVGVSGACRYLGEGSYGVVIAADDKTDKDTKVRLGEGRGREEGGRGGQLGSWMRGGQGRRAGSAVTAPPCCWWWCWCDRWR